LKLHIKIPIIILFCIFNATHVEALAVATIRVAGVQMASVDGDIEGNLARAEVLVEQAAADGAQIVLLPEFMPPGYSLTADMWDSGEPREGRTVAWLKETSSRFHIWLGTSYLEAEGYDFYNTFVLTGPEGKEEGRVRKRYPAGPEAYFFRGELGSHMIETALGRIGIGICYENVLCFHEELMYEESADIVLMPHSAPDLTPDNSTGMTPAERYAQLLGVPAVMVNKCGPWKEYRFGGKSTIADSDGTVKAQLRYQEGIIVADVTLDPSRKTTEPVVCQGYYSIDVPGWYKRRWAAIEFMGKLYYSLNPARMAKANKLSSAGKTATVVRQ
jgi:N-carbamoylputrescine amidase